MLDFNELFANYIDEELLGVFRGAQVNSCALDRENRALRIELESPVYISTEAKNAFISQVSENLKLSNIDLKMRFDRNAINNTAINDIIDRLRYKNVALNGYFNGAQYTVGGDTVDICLKYGGYREIGECAFIKQFSAAVNEMFGFKPEVTFSGQLEEVAPALPVEEKTPAVTAEKAEVKEKKQEPDVDLSKRPADGLPIYKESAKLFYGRKINTEVKPLREIIPPANPDEQIQICAWGEVSNCETRDVNTRRGGKNAGAARYVYNVFVVPVRQIVQQSVN